MDICNIYKKFIPTRYIQPAPARVQILFERVRFIFCKILEGELNSIMDQNLTHYIHEHPSNIRFRDWKGNIGSASLNSVKML